MPTSVYPTADGFVNVAASGNPIFGRMCEAFGDPALARHPDYANAKLRSKNRVALNAAIARHTGRYTSAALIELLAGAGGPCGPKFKEGPGVAAPQGQHLGQAGGG